jgi:pentatricopeptide repeat protein
MLQSVLNDMREANAGADSVICAILLKACCSQGKVTNAMELFHEIQGKCFQWDHAALNALLLACSRADSFEYADEVFQEMRRVKAVPTHMAVTTMVKMYGRARMPQSAEAVIEIFQNEFGVKPSLQAYANLLQAFTQNRMWRQSLDIFARLTRSGIQLDASTSAAILQACIKLGEYDTAMELVRKSPVQLPPAVLQSLSDAMRSSQRHALLHELTTLMSARYSQNRQDFSASKAAWPLGP